MIIISDEKLMPNKVDKNKNVDKALVLLIMKFSLCFYTKFCIVKFLSLYPGETDNCSQPNVIGVNSK
jgi:hypothetical protein